MGIKFLWRELRFTSLCFDKEGGAPVAEVELGICWFGMGVSGAMPPSLISIAAIMALALTGMAIVDVSHEVVVQIEKYERIDLNRASI